MDHLPIILRYILLTFCKKKVQGYLALISERYIFYRNSGVTVHQRAIMALIVAEDHRFYRHSGIDLYSLARALIKTIIFRKTEGGSTIEQQLARTISGRYELSIRRKLIEFGHAVLISHVVPKGEIPGMYLFYAYFGSGMQGFDQATKRLKYKPENLTLTEACLLVARLKYPEPIKYSAQRREKIVLRSNHILAKYRDTFGGEVYVPDQAILSNRFSK